MNESQTKVMLGLKTPTDPRWVDIVEQDIEEILTDHAFCEQKAATNAISNIVRFPDYPDLVDAMVKICHEEMTHFAMVHDELKKRGLRLGRERKDPYVRDLMDFIIKGGSREEQLVDRMLFAAMIEARSCERFRLLSLHISDESLTALGQRAGQPLMRVFSAVENDGPSERELRTVAGFNLHVSIPIQGDDRRGLERQLRYMGRPPLSKERLTKTADGRIVVKLKSFWRDGTSHIVLTPHEFMERLVALVPPPRKNQIRYSGVFASNSKLRKRIVPKKEEEQKVISTKEGRHSTSKSSRKYSSWAKLMARVFSIDVLQCPRCQSKLQVLSFITEPAVIKNILTSLKMATAPPEPARSSFVSEQSDFIYEYDYTGSI